MAQLISPFNPSNYNPEQSAGNLPLGKHPVVIESSEVKATKANDGGYVQLNLKVIDGPSAGLTGPYRLHIYNASEKAVASANRQLSAICHVVNVFGDLTTTDPLHNIPFIVEVVPQKDNPQYTEVSRVFDINGNEPGKAPAGQAQTQQPQQQPTQGGAGQQWGGQQQQPANNGGWGQPPANNGQQQPEQQQPQQNNGGQQWGAPQGGQQPAWGQGSQQPQGQQQGANGWQQQPNNGNAGGVPWGQK